MQQTRYTPWIHFYSVLPLSLLWHSIMAVAVVIFSIWLFFCSLFSFITISFTQCLRNQISAYVYICFHILYKDAIACMRAARFNRLCLLSRWWHFGNKIYILKSDTIVAPKSKLQHFRMKNGMLVNGCQRVYTLRHFYFIDLKWANTFYEEVGFNEDDDEFRRKTTVFISSFCHWLTNNKFTEKNGIFAWSSRAIILRISLVRVQFREV